MRPATRVLTAGLDEPVNGTPLLAGPTFAAVYHLAGDPATTPFTYGRHDNPTWARFEQALGELEGGTAVAFASGMAAVTAVLSTVLGSGDTVVLPADGYYNVRWFAETQLARWGIRAVQAPTGRQLDLVDGARLLWLETPSNPGLDVCDIRAAVRAAHAAGALVAVDNTTATPLGQQPLALGADFSVASDTKALTGHGDLVLGHAATADPELAGALRTWRRQTGAIPGPMETWLAHRSLATLHLRLERQCATAQRVAGYLAGRPEVTGCRYPGLEADPAHEVAADQMAYFGPVVSFALDSAQAAEAWLSRLRIVTVSTSFGGLHSTAERRARWGGDDVPGGFIRLSVGCEDPDDLLEDLEQAFAG